MAQGEELPSPQPLSRTRERGSFFGVHYLGPQDRLLGHNAG